MSDATTIQGATPPPEARLAEAVIRIAGNSQDGIQAIGGFLARLAGRSEQEVMTFMTIPSTISGGPSIFQVRIGTGEVRSAGDQADVLLAFYQHSYDGHIGSLRPGGVVLYDSDHVTPNPELEQKYRHVGVGISSMTVEAIGGAAKDKGKNIFALGLIAKMFDLPTAKLAKLLEERFGGKDPSVLQNAMAAFSAGHAYSLERVIETFRFAEAQQRTRPQVVMNGNEAVAYGLIAAGVRFGTAYPITPWSDIMEILRRELPKYGGIYVQCEDEIAAICMALGGSFGGRVAVTGTSGPGLSLKTEALGWGVMAEMPLVLVDVQRGGPSTGLPTMVEQSDLNIAVFGSHGDAPRVVLGASDVEDCFYTAIEAVNLAREFSVPVILLTDQSIGTRIEAFPEPDLEKVCQDLTPSLEPVATHKPYDLDAPDGVTRHLPAGTRILDGKYPIATGLEHDEYGHPTGSPKVRKAMMAKRRRKLQKLRERLPLPEIYGPAHGRALLVTWGSSRGSAQEAVDRSNAAGEPLSMIHLRYLNPLPLGLDALFNRFERVYTVELNDEGLNDYGQLAGMLRAQYCDNRIRSITKIEGLTFKVSEILDQLKARLARDAGSAA